MCEVNACVCTLMGTCVRACVRACASACVCACMFVCECARAQACYDA